MFERRQAGADRSQAALFKLADDNSRPLRLAIEDLPPGVDQHAVAVRLAPIFVATTLRDGQYVALILDRPGTQQDLPVRPPGGFGKCRGNDQ